MNFVIAAVTGIVEMLFTSIYLRGLFQNYERKLRDIILAYVIAGTGLVLISGFLGVPIISLTYSFVAIMLLAKLLFKTKWLSAFYSALLLCVITVAVETACSGIMQLFGVQVTTIMQVSTERIIFIVIAKLLETFCIVLVIRLSQWRKSEDSLISAIPLFLCQVFSVFIGYIMYLGSLKSEQELSLNFLIAAIGILYINIVIFLYVERVKKIAEIKKQNELAEQLFNSKLDYFNQVKRDQEQTRSLWHDIKKYMNTMQELIRMGDIANAKACIDQVSGLFEETGTIVDVGNTVVSAVLNHSVQKARRQNIDINLDVRVKEELHISAADLSVIVGNTFDNAIEAVSPLLDELRSITVQLIQRNDILFYEISNPLVILSEKKNNQKMIQGYGLKNVQRCIDKYKGHLSVDQSEGQFKVSAMINVA